MIFQQDHQRLHFYHTEVEDEGTYQCKATSSIGFDSVEGKLRIRGICYVYFIKEKKTRLNLFFSERRFSGLLFCYYWLY